MMHISIKQRIRRSQLKALILLYLSLKCRIHRSQLKILGASISWTTAGQARLNPKP